MAKVTEVEFKRIKKLLKSSNGGRHAKTIIASAVNRSYELVRVIDKFRSYDEYKKFLILKGAKVVPPVADQVAVYSMEAEKQIARANRWSGAFLTLLFTILGVALSLFLLWYVMGLYR